jgi:Ran GTPase-activating protein (RanGAP) involved in mRNA processing and transport
MLSSSLERGPDPLHFRLPPDPMRNHRLSRSEALNLFAPLAEKPFTHVSLVGCALRDGAAAVVAEQLINLAGRRSLVSLSLADCVAGLPEHEALRSLSIVASAAASCEELNSLDLSDNSLGAKGLSACAPLFQNPVQTLRTLKMSKSALGPDSARLIRSFFTATHAVTSLESLCIDNNLLSSAGVLHIASVIDRSPHLKHLRLSSLRAGADAITRVLTSLATNVSTLESLDLSDNQCDVDAALPFSGVCEANTGLRSLSLRDMNLNDDTAYVILRALVMSPVLLETLDLSCNDLTGDSGDAVAFYLVEKSATLVTLALDDNNLGDDAAIRIASALIPENSLALRLLSLSETSLSDLGAVRVASAVYDLVNLERLEIGGNTVHATVLEVVKTALGDRLAHVNINLSSKAESDGARLSNDARQELNAALNDLSSRDLGSKQPSAITATTSSQSAFAKLYGFFSSGGSVSTRALSPQSTSSIAEMKSADINLRTPSVTKSKGRSGTKTLGSIESIASPSAIVSSARELRAQVLSLDREVGTLVQELQSRRESLAGSDADFGFSPRLSIIPTEQFRTASSLPFQMPPSKSIGAELLSVAWACLLALFLVVLLVGIVQSQDELTFLMKPV